MKDKFKATWVSHSSIGDFLECPRLYYLRNVYKDPKTGRKVNIVNPYMSLGIAVHNVLEGLVEYSAEDRMNRSLTELFKEEWKKVSGKIGGFEDQQTEDLFYERGLKMIERAENNPKIFMEKTIKIKEDLPWFWLDEEEEIILCGKIDWIRYVEETDSVEIIDFKTGKNKEADDSFQLPIYMLLMKNCQDRETTGAFYWYLETDDDLTSKELPDIEKAKKDILSVAKIIKKARQENNFICPHGGCKACKPFEKILKGEAEYVGVGPYRQDLYLISKHDKLL
jgi:ATP-dependent helicase/DNAse subunit B